MSGVRVPHLQRRNGVFHLRMRVPEHVRPLLGLWEVRRSLQTCSPSKARLLAARYAARVWELFDVISTTTLQREQVDTLLQQCFADLVQAEDRRGGFIPQTVEPYYERDEQAFHSQEYEAQLRSQLDSLEFDPSVVQLAERALAPAGVSLSDLPPPAAINFLSGVARAMVQRERLFRLRLDDRLIPFVPNDPIFRPLEDEQRPADRPTGAERSGMTVADAVAQYLQFGRGRWVRKTHDARKWQLGFFVEHVGPTTKLLEVTADLVRSYRDAVRCLHRMHGKRVGMSFSARLTPNEAHRITDRTASLTFEPVRTFFRWALENEGIIQANPADAVRLTAGKKQKGLKVRRSFSTKELSTLFAMPIFTGCASRHRRYQPGKHVIKDAKFWLPILGLYTGARLGELVQLHFRDLHLDGEFPYLSIDEDNSSDAGTGNRKHVKSEAGIRRVPLHSDVLALGFAAFVARRSQATGRSRVRLFSEFPYGSDGQASTVASKWFARFMDEASLTDPALVFHSFRHTAEDAFRDALIPQYVIDRVIGHSDGSVSAGYGSGPSLEVMHAAVQKMRLPYYVRVDVP